MKVALALIEEFRVMPLLLAFSGLEPARQQVGDE
jgi:hypothetical protein